MNLGTIRRTLLRRWLILVIGIGLTGIGTAAVYTAVPRAYQARSQAIILLPPTASSNEYLTGPFLYLPNSLNVLARVVAAGPNTDRFRAEMVADGYTAQYELGVAAQGPTVRFSVEGGDPAMVKATQLELLRRFEAELRRMQLEERVPARQMAHARFLDVASAPDPISGDRFRAAAATAGIGLLLTLLAVFLVECALRAWAQRAAQRLLQAAVVAEPTAAIGSQAPDAAGAAGATKDAGVAAELAGESSSDGDATDLKLFPVGMGPRD